MSDGPDKEKAVSPHSSAWGGWKFKTLDTAMRDRDVTRPAFQYLYCVLSNADKGVRKAELANSFIRTEIRMSDSTQLIQKKLLKRLGYFDYKEGRYRRGKGGFPTVFTFPEERIKQRANVVLDRRIVAAEQPINLQEAASRRNRSKPPGRRYSMQEPASRERPEPPVQFAGKQPHSLQEAASKTRLPEERGLSIEGSVSTGKTQAREAEPVLVLRKAGAFAEAHLALFVSRVVDGAADLDRGKALLDRMPSGREFVHRLRASDLAAPDLHLVQSEAQAAAELAA